MMWIIYSLLVAVLVALKGAAGKKCLDKMDEYVVAWFMQMVPAMFLLCFFIFIEIPVLGDKFWPVLVLDCFLSAIAAVWSTKALISEFSVTIPMTAFTPLFLLLTGWVLLGEVPSESGLIGVVLIVIGTYVLNFREKKNGWMAPFRALVRNKGPQLMLGAALIWSVTASLDKIAVQNSSPIFFAMTESFLIGIFISPFAYKSIKKQKKEIREGAYGLMVTGILAALMLAFQMIAITQTLVVYVNSIKRLGILFSIVLGGIIFKEKDIRLRLAGGCVMVLGVLLITL